MAEAREASRERPPPLRVPVGRIYDPTAELFEWMPVQTQDLIIDQIPASVDATGRTGLPLIAEAMARGLAMTYEGIAEARTRSELRTQLAMRDWIRDTMDRAHHESIFGDFLKIYEEALVRHSEGKILEVLDEVPPELIGLYFSLSEREGWQSPPGNATEKMTAFGAALGLGVRQLSLGAVYYGAERGLFSGAEFGLSPELKALAGRLGPGPNRDFELVDASYFEMLRAFREAPRTVENDWGSIHPLVRGFAQTYEGDTWVRAQGVERIERAVEEVQDYATRPPH